MAHEQQSKTAIIIGAGVGGIATATRLAHAGFHVTVLEKNAFTGGRCSLLFSSPASEDRYRFDQGPSLLLLPHLFHQTFDDLDTSLAQEGVRLVKCEPNYNIHFGDGEMFQLSSDLSAMKTEIEKWEGKAGFERYTRFLGESHRHYELSVEHVLCKNFTSLRDMFRWEFFRHLLDLHPFESIWTRAGRYFWTERLRRVFTFGSMYMGMSPFDAPGTYSLLQYTELAEGIWYPIGGFHRIVEALVGIGKRLGVTYKLESAVQRILLTKDGSRALGVELEGGERLYADVVVNNADLVYAYSDLLPPSAYSESLKKRPGSCSSISFYWGLDRKVPELEAHNIFLADDYRESFDSIFQKHLIPDEPSFYVNVPSRVDPTAAPDGKDAVVVLVPVGHLGDDSNPRTASTITETTPITDGASDHGMTIKSASPASQPGIVPTAQQDWPSMIALARRTILSTISSRAGVDLTPLIVHEQTNSPQTWKTAFNLDKGAILGLSHSFFNVLCFRPSTRARHPHWTDKYTGRLGVVGRILETGVDAARGSRKDVQGLYMVGASAHPGTGVPIVLAGGALVAEQVCQDFDVEMPWRRRGRGRTRGRGDQMISVKNTQLDRIERSGEGSGMSIWITLVVLLGGVWAVFFFPFFSVAKGDGMMYRQM